MFKEAVIFIWGKCPWYIKWFFAIVVLPNAIAAAFAFYVWFMPWHSRTIEASIVPHVERQTLMIKSIVQHQSFQNQSVQDSLKRIEQHQAMMFSEMLRRNNP